MTAMIRDARDVWPDNVPVGTFDITPGGLKDRPSVSAHMLFVCPNGKRCGLLLGEKFEDRRTADEPCVWQWDGNLDSPTITPSINCIAEKDGKPTGGCGWHGSITAGNIK